MLRESTPLRCPDQHTTNTKAQYDFLIVRRWPEMKDVDLKGQKPSLLSLLSKKNLSSEVSHLM